MTKGDSAASHHYICPQDKSCLSNVQKYNGPSVILPDADSIPPSHQGNITISKELSQQAQRGTILPKLQSSSLISLGQICVDNCKVLLEKKELHAIKNNKVVLKGYCNFQDGLWDIPILKTNITPNNIVWPSSRASIYPSQIPNDKE